MLTAFWTGGGREWAMQVTKADYDMMMMIQGLENELYWLRTAAVEASSSEWSFTRRCRIPHDGSVKSSSDTDVKSAAAQLQVV